MRRLVRTVVAALGVAAALAGGTTAAQAAATTATPQAAPTAGLTRYTDDYTVQHPYDLPTSARFSISDGVYNTWILKGDKPHTPTSNTGPRTEMRWKTNWTSGEHMWEADVLIDPGTEHTCIMQIKSNTAGEAIYVQVQNGGDIYHGSHALVARDMWGKWFHLTADYNPSTGAAHIWINNSLAFTTHYADPSGTEWYFKNGVYNLTGNRSETHFKNIRFWHG
ncbi:polysaccharide lyase family 7 protein [Gandjariella thermophila]|nr:polysaccharide lyase family 7 protein [Gandjariella thermophila]